MVRIDYATWYPEAIPLRKVTSQNIVRELALLFSCVRIPKDLLSDQGTSFVSKLRIGACQLLQVKQLRILVYHSQIYRHIECFNQILKVML